MVSKLACVSACLLMVVASCTTDKDSPDDIKGGQQIVAADTANAVVLSAAEARVDSLKLNYAGGEVYRYRTEQSTVGGPDTTMTTSTSVHYYTKRIKSKRADGNFEVGITFDSIRTDFSVKNMLTGAVLRNESFTSSDSVALKDRRNAHYAAVLGVEVTMIITPQGKAQEIIGASTIVNRMIPQGENPTPQQKEQLKQQVETSMFGAFSEQEYLRFPTDKLDSTLSWNTSSLTDLGDMFEVESKNTYRLGTVKKVKGLRIAEVNATIDGKMTAKAIPPQYNVVVRLKKSMIAGQGRTVVDLDKGYTITKSNEVRMAIDAEVENKATKRVDKGEQKSTIRYSVELLR